MYKYLSETNKDNKTATSRSQISETPGKKHPPRQRSALDNIFGISSGCKGALDHATLINRAAYSNAAQTTGTLLQAQRHFGNRHVQRLLSFTKHANGTAEVAHEVEKDRVRSSDGTQGLHSKVLSPMANTLNADFDVEKKHENSSLAPMRQQTGTKLQRKLSISQPGDQYEQEADHVAEVVMKLPEPIAIENASVSKQTPSASIHRLCSNCEEDLHKQPMKDKSFQTKGLYARTSEVDSKFEAEIQGARGGGQVLPKATRGFFEPRFGYDLGDVRIHTDAHAARMARDVSARAFTVGRDVFFGEGEYAPEASSGRRLLAHELTHVIQQTGGEQPSDSKQQRIQTCATQVADRGDKLEKIAHAPDASTAESALAQDITFTRTSGIIFSGFGGCWADYLNIGAAGASAIGACGTAIAGWVAPEPIMTKAVAVLVTIGCIGALLWVVSAIIATIDCLEEEDSEGNSAEIEQLRRRQRFLEQRIRELQSIGGEGEEAESREDEERSE